jgi:hypothetical protein
MTARYIAHLSEAGAIGVLDPLDIGMPVGISHRGAKADG